MNKFIRLIAISLFLILTGCQAWQYQRISDLPSPAAIPEVSEPGKVEIWFYDGISGTKLENLTTASIFPDKPTDTDELTSLDFPGNRGPNYGALVRGYLSVPEDGGYKFYLSGNNETEFWLSRTTSTDDIKRIAYVPDWTYHQEYTKYSSQISPILYLSASQTYYFEVRLKESGGSDNFSVAWEGPGISRQIVPSSALMTYAQTLPGSDSTSDGTDYSLGYKVGYFDGKQGVAFNPSYPPLDKDGDGLYDNWEVVMELNPNDPGDATSDVDNDLLTAIDEFDIGTSPVRADTDGDGIPDGGEFAFQLDPLNSSDASQDRDNDGATNLEEYLAGTDMDNESDYPATSSDGTSTDSGTAAAGSVTLLWTAPSTRTDGSSLALSEIDYYVISYGTSTGSLDQTVRVSGSETSYTIEGLDQGTWYFTIRVVDSSGVSSDDSSPVSYTVN
ncbi:fibronectin type III domain-containing protein [Marinobacter pelagius]|uniref:PA14 domain-containing protein n=1 Tax=Marinobacter sp. C7 TaxID=2951363 RepID=UPI001EF152A2|nr:PA14 domain-containing protein [Marinobacter sp. C7]MCG7199479.1 fibronectin type III domain-containing protein [Marinobacter sp. C7]